MATKRVSVQQEPCPSLVLGEPIQVKRIPKPKPSSNTCPSQARKEHFCKKLQRALFKKTKSMTAPNEQECVSRAINKGLVCQSCASCASCPWHGCQSRASHQGSPLRRFPLLHAPTLAASPAPPPRATSSSSTSAASTSAAQSA